MIISRQLTIIIFLLTQLYTSLYVYSQHNPPAFVIATLSDLHGQLDPAYIRINDTTIKERGGIARIKTAIDELKQRYANNVITCASGDFFVEDFRLGKYISAFGSSVIAYFLNSLPIDAATIGNHEFDFGIQACDEALCSCTFPIIATNFMPSGISTPILKKYILHRNGYSIGIIGTMNPKLSCYGGFYKQPSNPLLFDSDQYETIQTAINTLKEIDAVDCIVVLSHLGFNGDKKLAHAVNGIDVICGGHTHTVLASGHECIIDKPNGHKTIIVHSGDRGLYLGVLKLWPTPNKTFTHEWELIDIDTSISHDQTFQNKLEYFNKLLPNREIIATTNEPIDASRDSVRKQENTFANFVTDLIRKYFNADIVLFNGGSIRGRGIIPPGSITNNDLDILFSFNDNTLWTLKATGNTIRRALEISVAYLPQEARNFLHPSGLRYQVDITKPAAILQKDDTGLVIDIKKDGQRIVAIDVEQHDGSYQPLDDSREYTLIITTLMLRNYSELFMFKNNQQQHDTTIREKTILLEYLKKHPEIIHNKDGRITFIEKHAQNTQPRIIQAFPQSMASATILQAMARQ